MSARGWGSHSQTESHTKPPQGEKQGEWNITINLPTKPHTNPWSSPHRRSVFLMRSSITYPNRWVQSSEDPPNGRWSSGGSQRWWIYGARASHIASNQWAFITSSNTRNNLQSCGKRNGLPWKNTKHRELRSIARWSGWWHPWAISRPSWCSEKWVNEVDHTIQSLRCREAWRPISSRAESHTKPQKGESRGRWLCRHRSPDKPHTRHPVMRGQFWWHRETNPNAVQNVAPSPSWLAGKPSILDQNQITQQSHGGITSLPAWQPIPTRSHLVAFTELVDSYKTGKTSFEDLILEVRCEACFTSVFEEAQQQLGADSQILDMLADEFPIYHQNLIKKQK